MLHARVRRPTFSGQAKRLLAGTVAALTLAAVAMATPKPAAQDVTPGPMAVSATPMAGFDRTDRALSTFGKLEWRGGVVLTSPEAAFGGWSGLAVDTDGKTFLAVSDAGTWMTGKFSHDSGRLSGVADTRLGPIIARDGKAAGKSLYRDPEAVALASGSLAAGTLLIAFEQRNRIARFGIGKDGLSQPSAHLSMPAELKSKSGNDGIEAVTVLRGGPAQGAIVAMTEAVLTPARHHAGWIWQGNVPRPFAVTEQDGFCITDVASLANGDLLVLERRFRWSEGVKVRLRRVAAAQVKPNAVVTGETLMSADMEQDIDNFEGLGVHENAAGETIVTLISDDNFNRLLQRTLLVQFALTDSPRQHTAGP